MSIIFETLKLRRLDLEVDDTDPEFDLDTNIGPEDDLDIDIDPDELPDELPDEDTSEIDDTLEDFADDEFDDDEDHSSESDESISWLGAIEDEESDGMEDIPTEPAGDIDQQPMDRGQEGTDELDDLDVGDEEQQPEEEPEDPNRAGVIRFVPGAHLVYKREGEDGTYEEMWIYNAGKFKKDLEVRKKIIAGTDIAPNSTQSPDGKQQITVWSSGNADIVVLGGLPQ